jgi:hypothetical protein
MPSCLERKVGLSGGSYRQSAALNFVISRAVARESGTMIPEMTLQDWFAGQVMAAMIGSDPAYASTRDNDGRLCGIEPARLVNMSKNAYQAAAAMMQARAAAGLEAPAVRRAVEIRSVGGSTASAK